MNDYILQQTNKQTYYSGLESATGQLLPDAKNICLLVELEVHLTSETDQICKKHLGGLSPPKVKCTSSSISKQIFLASGSNCPIAHSRPE